MQCELIKSPQRSKKHNLKKTYKEEEDTKQIQDEYEDDKDT